MTKDNNIFNKDSNKIIELANHRIGAISGVSKEQQVDSREVRYWLSGVQIIAHLEDGKDYVEGVCLFQVPKQAAECKDMLNGQFQLAKVNKEAKIIQYPVF